VANNSAKAPRNLLSSITFSAAHAEKKERASFVKQRCQKVLAKKERSLEVLAERIPIIFYSRAFLKI
jgi:hypothetical protein